ncbi:PLD nuclease N-terminal domain-containing protein [Alteribacter aurantiacus]|uniref:PLD nuclease N-terminal domain-containing protein n=1 Tax=Alteribacter aurantiacus TaxID=254410 RepID=UPI00040A281A|nr:PLD nuclease N-terminal domain-containing protein [Alteribacter aurantiacus]
MDMINWGVVAPLIAIQLILMTVALLDLVKRDQVNGEKWVWAIVIVVFNTIGPIAYFIFGRKTD